MRITLRKIQSRLLTVVTTVITISIAFVMAAPGQASAAYRIPSGVTLMPSAPISPGHVVPQTVIANDTQWAYFISVPPTYDSTGSKLWPCILFMPTLECAYTATNGQPMSIIMTTHCWNGGLAEIMQTPTICTSFYDRFVVLTPFTDEPMLGANQGGKPERLAGFINYMKRHLKIDSTQISCMGHCWGGGVLYNLATVYPKLLSCMVLINGNDTWASTYNAANACKLVSIPIKLLSGNSSNRADSLQMTAAHQAIQACGTNKETITYFANNMHEMWSGPQICGGVGIDTMKSIYDWMLTNRLATSVTPNPDNNRMAISAWSMSNVSAGDQIELIGLNGQVLLKSRTVADPTQMNRMLSQSGRGVHVLRVRHGIQPVERILLSR